MRRTDIGDLGPVDVAMAMRLHRFGPRARLAAMGLLLCLATAMPFSPAVAQHVVVMVNGSPITSLDIEFRSRLIELSTHKKPTRQDVLDKLIEDKLKIKEAKRYSVGASKQEVDAAFANIAKRMGATPERLSQILSTAGSSATSLKTHIEADLVWSKLVRGRFQSSLQIQEKDILATMGTDKEPTTAFEYVLRPILIVVPRGTSQAAIAAKHKEAEVLRTRFQNCEQGIAIAHLLRDVAVRPQITRNAADLTPQLRAILDAIEIGHLTNPEVTANGIEMFALCGKRSTTQDTPGMRQAREKIYTQRFEARAKRYLDEVKRGAMIEYREQTAR
jgi:peptidyl-prolyl cis-trans isomerase SurA